MTRRQPYAHNLDIPTSASPEPAEDPFKTDSLEIVLNDDPEVVVTADPPKKEDPVVAEPEPSPEPVAEPKPSADDEAYARLKSQLEREKQAREAAQRRTQELESQHLSTQERLRQERERTQVVQRDHLEAQETAIENAISYTEAQAVQAQREITRALSDGDYEASSNAYRLLAKAESDLARLKEGKQAIEAQKKAPIDRLDPPSPTQTQSQPQNTWERIEAYITQPAHPLRAQQYMRDHYDDLFRDFDTGAQRLSKLVGGHWLAKADGVTENTDSYYDYLDRHMGYRANAPEPQPKSAPPPTPAQPKARNIPPSAPVSRGAAHDSVSGTSVTLTKAEVEFCNASGIKPSDYARNKLVALKGANDPSYSGPRFTNDR